jgi:hypothetical protein
VFCSIECQQRLADGYQDMTYSGFVRSGGLVLILLFGFALIAPTADAAKVTPSSRACKADMDVVTGAEEAHHAMHGRYGSMADLSPTGS